MWTCLHADSLLIHLSITLRRGNRRKASLNALAQDWSLCFSFLTDSLDLSQVEDIQLSCNNDLFILEEIGMVTGASPVVHPPPFVFQPAWGTAACFEKAQDEIMSDDDASAA